MGLEVRQTEKLKSIFRFAVVHYYLKRYLIYKNLKLNRIFFIIYKSFLITFENNEKNLFF